MAPDAVRRALVLGAGGNAASSFEVGLIVGMADAGLDVRDADVVIGTSAGARVGAQLMSGLTLDELFARQIASPRGPALPKLDWMRWREGLLAAKAGGGDTAEILRRIGSLAHAAPESADLRAAIAAEFPSMSWPERQLLLAAVEIESGSRRVFDRASGIELVDAVAASGTLPGVRPAIAFAGSHFIDGGFYSMENADLAAGADRVLVLALRASPLSIIPLEAAVEDLRRSGARVEVVHPDETTQAVFASGNILDPAVREPATKAAREYGRRIAKERIAAFW